VSARPPMTLQEREEEVAFAFYQVRITGRMRVGLKKLVNEGHRYGHRRREPWVVEWALSILPHWVELAEVAKADYTRLSVALSNLYEELRHARED
jgi:hypothetical protein